MRQVVYDRFFFAPIVTAVTLGSSLASALLNDGCFFPRPYLRPIRIFWGASAISPMAKGNLTKRV